MTYSEYIKSILDTIAKHTNPNSLSIPDLLTYQLVGQTQVHPNARNQLQNAIQMAASEEQLDGLIIDYFKLLQTQVENLDFKAAENMTGILDAVPLLNNTGMHDMGKAYKYSFAAKVNKLLEFLNGVGPDSTNPHETMRKIKEGVLDRYADELKNIGIVGSASIPAGGTGFARRSTIASMGKNIPDNLLLFMIDMPNRVYKAYDIMGETDVEVVARIIESIKEYKVEEFIDDKFLQEITEIVDGPNLQDATDFLRSNNFREYVSGAANVKAYKLHEDIIHAMALPIVELTRVYAAESVTYRNAVQYMRLLSDDVFTEIIDTLNVSTPRSAFINLLRERDVKFISTKEFVQDLTKRLRKGAEMYNKFDFEELLDNPNMVNELKNDLSRLMYTYQEWHDVITTRGGDNLPSPVRDALMKTKYAEIFDPSQAANYFESIEQFFGDPISNNINDVSNAVEELGLFDTTTLDFIKESNKLPQGSNNFINFMDPPVANQNPIAKALNIVKNKNVPIDNGFDIFSFKPPANEIFHVGPSIKFVDELYKIKDIGDIELWNWTDNKFIELTGDSTNDAWLIAEQIIGDVKNAPALLAEEVQAKGMELPDRVIIKVNKPSVATSQALLSMNNKVAVPNQVKAGDRITEVVKNMDADKLEDVVNILKTPKIGSAIASTAIDFAKKAGKFTGGTVLTALAPGDVAIELGLKRLLPKLGLAAISGPALAAYTAYELALLAADATNGLAAANKAAGVGQNEYGGFSFTGGKTIEGKDVNYKAPDFTNYGKNFWEGFTEDSVSDKYSIGYKLTKEVHNSLFEEVYGRIAQDLYAGTDS